MIRRAENRDIPAVLSLLSQVLELHAAIRPDVFVSGTTKYTADELEEIFADDTTPVYVETDDSDAVLGYVFCIVRDQPLSNVTKPLKTLYIDDLCVDADSRGQHLGEKLFRFACAEARRLGCYEVMLSVWEGNDGARRFYDRMGMKPKRTVMELVL